MDWTVDQWIEAWGANLALIATEFDDLLPEVPREYRWMVTRDMCADKNGCYPTWRITLAYDPLRHYECDIWQYRVIDRGQIDKKIYGDEAVIRLARAIRTRQQLDPPPPERKGHAPSFPLRSLPITLGHIARTLRKRELLCRCDSGLTQPDEPCRCRFVS